MMSQQSGQPAAAAGGGGGGGGEGGGEVGGEGGGRTEIQGFGSGNGTAIHQHYSAPCNPTLFLFQNPGTYTVNVQLPGAGRGQRGGANQSNSPLIRTPGPPAPSFNSPQRFTGLRLPSNPGPIQSNSPRIGTPGPPDPSFGSPQRFTGVRWPTNPGPFQNSSFQYPPR